MKFTFLNKTINMKKLILVQLLLAICCIYKSQAQTLGNTRYVIESKLRELGYIGKEELSTNHDEKTVMYYLEGKIVEAYYFTATGNICTRVTKIFPIDKQAEVIKALEEDKYIIKLKDGEYKSNNNTLLIKLIYSDEFIMMQTDPYDMNKFIEDYKNKGIF